MSVDQAARIAATRERLRAEKTVPGLLGATARAYVELLDAPACTISRVIGDLLVDLVHEERRPRTVSRNDPEPDANEVKLLQELGFDALLMVAIEAEDGAWGLVEVYGEKGRRFNDGEVELAQDLAGEVGAILRQLERPGA